MNENKSRQGEGYDFYDYEELAFNAVGGVETLYMVGANANALIQGIWLSETGVYLPNPLYLPVDAQNTLFYADVAVNIRLVSRSLAARQLAGILPAGLPVQITIPATTWITLPDKWFMINAVAVGVAAGTLIIKTSG